MSADHTHTIRRQNVTVNATVHDAFALKRKVALVMEGLSPNLNALFDELTFRDEWLQIDRLDIQVDGLSEVGLEEALSGRILKMVREKIEAMKHNSASVEREKNHLFGRVSVHQRTMMAFLYFLENGNFPWWFEVKSHANFEEQLAQALSAFIIDDKVADAGKISVHLRSVLQDPASRKRLSGQFGEALYLDVVQLLFVKHDLNSFAEIEKTFAALHSILKKYFVSRSNGPAINQLIRESRAMLLKEALVENSMTVIMKNWIQAVINLLVLRLPKRTKEGITENTDLEHAVALDAVLGKYFSARTEAPEEESFENISRKQLDQEEKAQPEKKKKADPIKELEQTSGTIICNAGLIIVAPFLPQLFRQCGIVEKDVLTDPGKAIAMMHYCVYGNCNFREYDVFLNKILCNLEVHLTIEMVEELSESEKKEIDSMLAMAIEHWSALKSTSPDGLREGFLARKGKLTQKHEEWSLHVEQKTIDALLQQLPWTIGFIKLPWMKKMLRTQWI